MGRQELSPGCFICGHKEALQDYLRGQMHLNLLNMAHALLEASVIQACQDECEGISCRINTIQGVAKGIFNSMITVATILNAIVLQCTSYVQTELYLLVKTTGCQCGTVKPFDLFLLLK